MKELEDLKVGDIVYCTGDSGFCDSSYEKIKKIKKRFDNKTGDPYQVIVLSGNRRFDGRDGHAINPPYAYYIIAKEKVN